MVCSSNNTPGDRDLSAAGSATLGRTAHWSFLLSPFSFLFPCSTRRSELSLSFLQTRLRLHHMLVDCYASPAFHAFLRTEAPGIVDSSQLACLSMRLIASVLCPLNYLTPTPMYNARQSAIVPKMNCDAQFQIQVDVARHKHGCKSCGGCPVAKALHSPVLSSSSVGGAVHDTRG